MTKFRIIGNELYRVYPSFIDQVGIIEDLHIDKNTAQIYYSTSFNPLLKKNFVVAADMGDVEVK